MTTLKNLARPTVIVWALLLLTACSRVELKPIPPHGVILAFGDSLTVGVGTEKSKSYPAVLSALSGREVINAGVSGEVTANGLARLDTILENTTVDLLILLEGGNDILRNHNLQQTQENLAQMIALAQRYGIDVVLVGVPEKKLFSSVAPFYRELADTYPVVFEGELMGNLLRQPQYKSDAIHLNEKGYRLMAESLYDLLVERGAF